MTNDNCALSNHSPLRHVLAVSYVGVEQLKPLGRETRVHSKKQIRKLARCIDRFGFVLPILIDDENRIVAGAALAKAAELLELAEVPAVRLSGLNEPELRVLRIALNRLSEEAQWDIPALALEFQDILNLDTDFDLTDSGFETGEIDLVIEGLGIGDQEDEVDALPPVDETKPTVSQRGDLWLLGSHRVLCGDATSAEDYEQLLDGRQAQMVFTDPPYNVPVDGHVCGLGAIRHGEFAMAAGEMSEDQFVDFLKTVFEPLAAHSCDGSIHFVFMDWRHLFEVLCAGRTVYSELKNVCVWNKTNGGMGSLYRSKHELVLVFKNGTAPHVNNVALGRHGRYRSNVWDYAGINGFGKGRQDRLAMHPTVKPVALVADAIRDCSKRNGLVLDPFGGSGTTLIAAEKTGRRAALMELEPRYVDLTIARWQALTGEKAKHAESGLTFDAAGKQRRHAESGDALTYELETVDV